MLPTPHLFQRGTVWWWRRRIPKNFAAFFSRRETVVSLRTNIPAEALARAARLRAATDALFDGVRQAMALGLTMSKAQMDAIILDLVHHEIEAAELARALAPPRSPGEAEAAVARARALRGEMQTALRLNQLDAARGPLDATLARLQMALAPEMPDYRLLLRKAAWGLANEVASAHEQHESGISATGAFFAPPAAAAAPGALVLATTTVSASAAPAPAPVPWPRTAAVPEQPAAPAIPPAPGLALEKWRAIALEFGSDGGSDGSCEADEDYGGVQAGGPADFVDERADGGPSGSRSWGGEVDAAALEDASDHDGIVVGTASGRGEGAGSASA